MDQRLESLKQRLEIALRKNFYPSYSEENLRAYGEMMSFEERTWFDGIKRYLETSNLNGLNYESLSEQAKEEGNRENEEFQIKSIAFLIKTFQDFKTQQQKESPQKQQQRDNEDFQLRDNQILAIIRACRGYLDPKSKGLIEELQVGEGKSSVIMPIVLAYLGLYEDYIQVPFVNRTLLERDREFFLEFAERLGVKDKVGVIKEEGEGRLQYPKKKWVFGLWSSFIHSYQLAFLDTTRFFPQKSVIFLDEIDHILLNEAQTPAVIEEGENITIDNLLAWLNQSVDSHLEAYNQERSDGEKNSFDIFGERIPFVREDFALERGFEEFKDFVKLSTRYLQDLLKLKQHSLGKNFEFNLRHVEYVAEELLSVFISSCFGNGQGSIIDKFFSQQRTNDLSGRQEKLRRQIEKEGKKFIKKRKQNLEGKDLFANGIISLFEQGKLPSFFWFANEEFLKALATALIMKKGRDYFIKEKEGKKEIIIISETTGYQERGKSFMPLITLILAIKEGFSDSEIESLNLRESQDEIGVADYYNLVASKIIGFSGTVLSVGKQLKEAYDLEVTYIPPSRKVNRQEEIRVIEPNEDRSSLIINEISSSSQTNILVVFDSIEEAEGFFDQISRIQQNQEYEIHLLTAENEEDAEKEYQWLGESPKQRRKKILITAKMIGRGIDLKPDDGIKKGDGFLLISTGFLPTKRDYDQLVGRVGRHGEKAKVILYLSEDDPVFDRFKGEDDKTIKKGLKPKKPKKTKRFLEYCWQKNEEDVVESIKGQAKFYKPFAKLREDLMREGIRNTPMGYFLRLIFLDLLEPAKSTYYLQRFFGGVLANDEKGDIWTLAVFSAIGEFERFIREKKPEILDEIFKLRDDLENLLFNLQIINYRLLRFGRKNPLLKFDEENKYQLEQELKNLRDRFSSLRNLQIDGLSFSQVFASILERKCQEISVSSRMPINNDSAPAPPNRLG